MITSNTNSKIKTVRRLLADRRYRYREQAYVIEGTRWLAEAAQAAQNPQFILVTPSWLAAEAQTQLLESFDTAVYTVSERLFSYASDTQTPSGVLAVLPMGERPLPSDPNFLLILDRVGDPGNMGTILRTAAAAGVQGVLLAPGCVDPYNPKVVRSSMGAHLRLPLINAAWPAITAQTAALTLYLAAADGALSYDAVDWRRPCALIIGSEASGAGAEAARLATHGVRIPMKDASESLNAAVAAGILLFEAVRQRS